MKLTIIPSDNTVYVDGKSYELDLSSCNIPDDVHALQWNNNNGEIEKQSINEEINSLPTWANDCYLLWQTKNNEENATKEPTLEENQKKASSLLFESDWVENPSVVDTNNTPHLLNTKEILIFFVLCFTDGILTSKMLFSIHLHSRADSITAGSLSFIHRVVCEFDEGVYIFNFFIKGSHSNTACNSKFFASGTGKTLRSQMYTEPSRNYIYAFHICMWKYYAKFFSA